MLSLFTSSLYLFLTVTSVTPAAIAISRWVTLLSSRIDADVELCLEGQVVL
jgi:hypothetical protein